MFLFSSLLSLFFPSCCLVCGRGLVESEHWMCVTCHVGLLVVPSFYDLPDRIESFLQGVVPLVSARAWLGYQKESKYRQLIFHLKYKGNQEAAESLGRWMAVAFQAENFFEGIDLLVPVPLHSRRYKQRGYNQSERIAQGVSAVTGIPLLADLIRRTRHTSTQTRLDADHRWENVKDGFELQEPLMAEEKHILLIDDVFTTGATVASCAMAFQGVKGVKVSVLTLAVAL
ncbi:MAG: ComF family protein [Bacteroides sp.]|nr:ComF family protein [Bacteroides sp.]